MPNLGTYHGHKATQKRAERYFFSERDSNSVTEWPLGLTCRKSGLLFIGYVTSYLNFRGYTAPNVMGKYLS